MAYRKSGTRDKKNNGAFYTYTEGNTIRKLDVTKELHKPYESVEISHTTRKNRDKALYMNLGYVLFLVAALVSTALILIGYIKVQSELTLTIRNIAKLESELNDLKLSNDEDYSRAASSVDLEEIRNVAIGELGMRYAKDGQIINVLGKGSDYVRQLVDFEE